MEPTGIYRGRFAPSPSGPLHLGSLLAALGSFLDARANGGAWLLRIEDIDPPREQRGAERRILDALLAHGLRWDEEVFYQHRRLAAYDAAIDQLLATGFAYYCVCSRANLKSATPGHADACPRSAQKPDAPAAIRLKTTPGPTALDDVLCGRIIVPPASGFPDPVIRRKDGLHAYQLAVVVDDFAQCISHVIRGRDLLSSTPVQMQLQHLLGYPRPRYGHLPLMLNEQGKKLSKQHFAPALDDTRAVDNLLLCLAALGQPLPPEGMVSACDDVLLWATEHWDPRRITGKDHICRTV